MSHENCGSCLGCAALFNKYPHFYQPLRDWFMDLQSKHAEAHISCAGRGRLDQEALFGRNATKAKYGESAHNWNAAIDVWYQPQIGTYSLDLEWFQSVIVPALTSNLCWYGRPGAPFPERPHIEINNWSDLAHRGLLSLVE